MAGCWLRMADGSRASRCQPWRDQRLVQEPGRGERVLGIAWASGGGLELPPKRREAKAMAWRSWGREPRSAWPEEAGHRSLCWPERHGGSPQLHSSDAFSAFLNARNGILLMIPRWQKCSSPFKGPKRGLDRVQSPLPHPQFMLAFFARGFPFQPSFRATLFTPLLAEAGSCTQHWGGGSSAWQFLVA